MGFGEFFYPKNRQQQQQQLQQCNQKQRCQQNKPKNDEHQQLQKQQTQQQQSCQQLSQQEEHHHQQQQQQQQHPLYKKQQQQPATQLHPIEQHQQNSPTQQETHQKHERSCLSKLTTTTTTTTTTTATAAQIKFSTQASCNDNDYVLKTAVAAERAGGEATAAGATATTAPSKSKRAHRSLLSVVYKKLSLFLIHQTAAKASTTSTPPPTTTKTKITTTTTTKITTTTPFDAPTKTNKLFTAAATATFPWLLAAFLLSSICIEPTLTAAAAAATTTTTTAIKTTTLVAATTSGAAVASAITASSSSSSSSSSTFDSVNVAAGTAGGAAGVKAAKAAVATTKTLATLKPPFEYEIDGAAAVGNIDDVVVVVGEDDDVEEEEQEEEEAADKADIEANAMEQVINGQTAEQQQQQQEREAENETEHEREQDNNNKNNNNVPSSNEQQLLEFYKQAQHHHHHQQQQQHQQQQHQQQQQHHRHRQRDVEARDSSVDTLPTVIVDSSPSTSLLTASLSSLALKVATTSTTKTTTTNTKTTTTPSTTTTTTTEAIPCEPKVLDEVPTEPFYDFTELTDEAAHEFTEFLATKFTSTSSPPPAHAISDQLKEELRSRANAIASNALNQDDNLLAFAIAAPTVDTVVVKFRDNVTIPPDQKHHKSSFLGSYWRELGLAWNSTDGSQEWGAPFRDCNLLRGRWLWPFRVSFAEFKIKIVAVVFIAADEDLCNDGLEEIFGRRHGCDRNTTFCLLTEVKPFASRDAYTCICSESFYLPNSSLQGYPGDIVELSEGYDNYSCIPCPGGCSSCDQNGVCLFGAPEELVSMENLLHVSVGSVLGACILCCIVLGVIVFQQRKCKAIASGMWTVLETILLGIVLLYASVAVHFFPASTERCLLEPWLRELGFITCYGAIILKLYRHLVDFRTRKAHRWVLRDVDLLKYLGTMVFAVICYMAAFTASSLDLIETAHLEGLRELRTNTCHPLKWELVTQVSEVLILCFGLHLAFASRNANTQFRDRQFLVASLVLEFLVSSSYYILRLIYLPELSPGAILLALFLRSQLTNTISLGLIFVPKLWFQHKQVRSLAHDLSIRLPVDAFKGSHDVGHHLGGGYAGLCLGDPDIGELTISEMSPEDIRAELKRLYTQLEILKNKTLRQDNPHISKRRGGRKQGHRRFSLQALSAKHRSNKHIQDVEITEAEPSRTPEDSVCSAEGPTDTYAEISGISHSMLSHSAALSHSK